MIVGLNPYAAYKDSGVPWLGEVPAHWEVRPGKRTFTPRKELARPNDIQLSATQAYGVIAQADYEKRIGRKIVKILRHLEKRRHVEVDDFVISMRSFQGGLERAWASGCIRSSYIVLQPATNLAVGYFAYLFKSVGYIKALQATANFIRDGQDLNFENFCEVDVPFPPLPEQTAIVRFLDHADRRIQRYIRAKQKLIALLEEQKQAIIHQAVTGQTDVRTGQPYPATKPSGVEWLGDIPEHWQSAALRHRYSQCLGKMLDSKRITGNHPLPYLRNVDVQWDRINTKDLPTMDIPPDEYGRYTVQQGDLLVCEGGEVGRCALWSDELPVCGFQKALHRLRPRKAGQDVPRFLHYALRVAVKGDALNDGHLSTIAHLTGDKLRAHRFPFPPVAEQKALVSFLDAVSKQADRAVSRAERQIGLLSEYRTRLIADVVTGKLDVREAAALPEVDSLAAEDTLDNAIDTNAT